MSHCVLSCEPSESGVLCNEEASRARVLLDDDERDRHERTALLSRARCGSCLQGVPIDFGCERTDLELVGAPNEEQAPWTIRKVLLHSTSDSYSYSAGPLGRIAIAWYGEGATT
jgi:hypothetical protein